MLTTALQEDQQGSQANLLKGLRANKQYGCVNVKTQHAGVILL